MAVQAARVPGTPSFVGRADEISALADGLARSAQGESRILLIGGEPGIGKTSLVREFQARSSSDDDALFVWGRCWAGDGVPAFWPWAQLLRGLAESTDVEDLVHDLGSGAAEIAQIVPEIRTRLPEIEPSVGLDPEQERFRLYESITEFLRRQCTRRRLVLAIDDLHAADPASMSLLQFAARHLSAAGLFLLATYRDTELAPGHPLYLYVDALRTEPIVGQLTVRGLNGGEARECMERAIGRAVPRDVASRIHRATAGNPFFVGEMTRLMLAAGDAVASDRIPTALPSLPDDVRRAVSERLAKLGASSRAVLHVGALLGKEFDLDLVRHLALREVPLPRGPALLAALEEATRARFLVEAESGATRFAFVHDLVRETLIQEIGAVERIAIHASIAETIERLPSGPTGRVEELAHHYYEVALAGEAVDRAIRYLVSSAEAAAARTALESAVEYYRKAWSLAEVALAQGSSQVDLLQAGRIVLALGEAEERTGDPTAESHILRAADIARRALEEEHGDAADLLGRVALAFRGEGMPTDVVDDERVQLVDEALRARDRRPDAVTAELLAHRARLLCWSRERRQSDEGSLEAVQVAEQVADPAALFSALDARRLAIWNEGPSGRLELATQMLRVAEETGDIRRAQWAHYWRSVDLLELGRVREAELELDRQEQLAAKLREPHREFLPAYLRAAIAVLRGTSDAPELSARAAEIGEEARVPDRGLIHAGQTYQWLRQQGGSSSRDLVALVQAPPDRLDIPGYASARAVVLAEAGDTRAAGEMIREVARDDFAVLRRDANWIPTLAMLATASGVAGEPGPIPALRTELEPYEGCLGFPGMGTTCTAFISHSLGLLAQVVGELDRAVAYHEAALRQAEELEAWPWVARIGIDLANALLRRRRTAEDLERARTLASTARDLADQFGLESIRLRTDEMLSQLPATESETPASPSTTSAHAARFIRDGTHWELHFAGTHVRVRDSKGLRCLSLLVERPGEDVHAIELEALASPRAAERVPGITSEEELGVRRDLGDLGPQVDAQAAASYRRRLADLREELEEAERLNDLARAAQAREEIEVLTQSLAAAFGLGGRQRPVGAHAERARLRVTQRIKATLKKLDQDHPALARHLRQSVRTGVFSAYEPKD